jgi:hypothetical protein
MLLWVLSGVPTLASADANQPHSRALATVEHYVDAQLRDDVEAVVAIMHPLWVKEQGGWDALVSRKREYASIDAIYRLDPLFVELGMPKLVSARELLFAVVPAKSLTPGFPEDIESRSYYVAVSEDRGATWYMVEMSCAGIQWATANFPGFPDKQLLSEVAEPFMAVSTIRPIRITEGARRPSGSTSTPH